MSTVIAAIGAALFFFGFGFAVFRLIRTIVKARSYHTGLPDQQARLAHDRAYLRARLGSIFISLGIAAVGGVLMVSVA